MPYLADWDRRRTAVLQRDGFVCVNCGAAGGPNGNAELHAHHIVNVASGGSHELSNLITLCRDCHTATHNDGIMAPTGALSPTTTAPSTSGSSWSARNGRWWIHVLLFMFTLGIGNAIYWIYSRSRSTAPPTASTDGGVQPPTSMPTVPVAIQQPKQGGLRAKYGGFWMHLLVALLTVWWTGGLGNILYALWRRARY